MQRIDLNGQTADGPVVMIFTEGTVIKPKSWLLPYYFSRYVPVGDAVAKITRWQAQGARIVYCTSRKRQKADVIADLLRRYSFPGEYVAARTDDSYKDVTETIRPDVLIEDDCKSIGGAWQMCITHVEPELKHTMRSVVVPEYGGIDMLPDDLDTLMRRQTT